MQKKDSTGLTYHLASILICHNYSVDAWNAGIPNDNYVGASDMINKVGEDHSLPSPRYLRALWQVVSWRRNKKDVPKVFSKYH